MYFDEYGFACFKLPYVPEKVSGHHTTSPQLEEETLRPMMAFFDLLYILDGQLWEKVEHVLDTTEFYDGEYCYGYVMKYDLVGNRRYLTGCRSTRYGIKELSLMWLADIIGQIAYHKFGNSTQRLFTSLEKRDVKNLWEAAGFVEGERPSFMLKWE